MDQPTHLGLLSGSLRDGATNTPALNTARMLAGDGVESVLYVCRATFPIVGPKSPRIPDDQPGMPERPRPLTLIRF